MAEVGSSYVSIVPSAKGFGAKLSSQIDPQLAASGKKSGVSFAKVLGGAIVGGFGAAVVGIGAIIHTGFGEMMDASAGTAQLAAGIKSTGNAAGVSVKGLNDLASSIQGYSGQTDDSIVASEQLLLTFTKIQNRGPDKIFDRATLATANMAAKMGGDASGAAIQLGKALNDPVKGISALSRVGVSFTAGQKKSIEAMVKHGDVAGAQKIILKELETEFGGAAKAAGDSLPGKLAKGRRAFEDLSQSIVEGAAPAIGAISDKIAADVVPAMKDFIQGFKDGTGAGGKFRDRLVDLKTKGEAVVKWLKDNTTAVKVTAVAVGVLTVAVQAHNLAMFISSGRLKAWVLQTAIVKTATAVWAAGQWLLNAALTANPIGLVVVAIGALVAGIVWVATKTTWFQTIWQYMTSSLGVAWRWLWNTILAPVIRFMLNGFASVTGGIATMLGALGNIPGFEWAKTAADKMAGAAGKARALAAGIKDIPPAKKVTVSLATAAATAAAGRLQARINLLHGKNLNVHTTFTGGAATQGHTGTNAAGTDNWRGGPTWVGERGPEIVNLPRGSQVIPNNKIGSAGGGSTFNIYPTPGMSEEQVGAAAARQVEWAMRGR